MAKILQSRITIDSRTRWDKWNWKLMCKKPKSYHLMLHHTPLDFGMSTRLWSPYLHQTIRLLGRSVLLEIKTSALSPDALWSDKQISPSSSHFKLLWINPTCNIPKGAIWLTFSFSSSFWLSFCPVPVFSQSRWGVGQLGFVPPPRTLSHHQLGCWSLYL